MSYEGFYSTALSSRSFGKRLRNIVRNCHLLGVSIVCFQRVARENIWFCLTPFCEAGDRKFEIGNLKMGSRAKARRARIADTNPCSCESFVARHTYGLLDHASMLLDGGLRVKRGSLWTLRLRNGFHEVRKIAMEVAVLLQLALRGFFVVVD